MQQLRSEVILRSVAQRGYPALGCAARLSCARVQKSEKLTQMHSKTDYLLSLPPVALESVLDR